MKEQQQTLVVEYGDGDGGRPYDFPALHHLLLAPQPSWHECVGLYLL